MRTLKKVGTEMALHMLAYNLKRVMNILGIGPLIAAMRVDGLKKLGIMGHRSVFRARAPRRSMQI